MTNRNMRRVWQGVRMSVLAGAIALSFVAQALAVVSEAAAKKQTGNLIGEVGLYQAAASLPGTDANGVGISKVEYGSITPLVTESGLVKLSLDALGTLSSSGTIHVDKPVGATVRKAYLLCASTGFTGYNVPNGTVTINGTPVNWDISTVSGISSWNHWADVTPIAKPIIDAAPAGIVGLTIGEGNVSGSIDGEILAVIFDDPNQVNPTTVLLLFGAQQTTGDRFNIVLSDPIQAGSTLDMSLGISYGYQGSSQYSRVTVNGNRLTTSAGGQDDGTGANGALITVGGIGDSNANPADPFATPTGPRSDDELYSLLPLVNIGDTAIQVDTLNPSNDDNIFFAAFVLSGGAVVNEGILLTPSYKENLVGTQHTVTATVQDDNGNPIVGRSVTITVIAGPHAGVTGTALTGPAGTVTLTYTGTTAGVDEIQATMIDSRQRPVHSNVVLKKWLAAQQPPVAIVTSAGNAGYYRLQATSPTYPVPSLGLYVADSAGPFVAGPFPSGTVIRLIRSVAAGTGPGMGPASVTVRVVGTTGVVRAKDPSGAWSAPVGIRAR